MNFSSNLSSVLSHRINSNTVILVCSTKQEITQKQLRSTTMSTTAKTKRVAAIRMTTIVRTGIKIITLLMYNTITTKTAASSSSNSSSNSQERKKCGDNPTHQTEINKHTDVVTISVHCLGVSATGSICYGFRAGQPIRSPTKDTNTSFLLSYPYKPGASPFSGG